MERRCQLCGQSTGVVTDNSPLGQLMFYEGICRLCAIPMVGVVVREDVNLTELGVVALYDVDARERIGGLSYATTAV